MTPDALRGASHFLILMGVAGFVTLVLTEHVWRLAGWAFVLATVLIGITLDIVVSRVERANELELERARRR